MIKKENIRNRKINLSKVTYRLPEIDEDRFILDNEYEQEQQESTQNWLDSFNNKSQYNITEMLMVATW